MNEYGSILIMFGIAIVFSGLFLLLSYIFGPKNPNKTKLSVYECGVTPTGNARERFSVKFYLIAILFIIFDIEVVFLYPWAVNFKSFLEAGKGLYMIVIMGIFFLMLVLGLFYEWRKGALDWGKRQKIEK
jgi:NADH-quinone oxidoreductase subunit A